MRILSVDGGGIRGIISIMILEDIEDRTGKAIHELFDLFCGTSTGGIITAALTASSDGVEPLFSSSDLFDFYTNSMSTIFIQKYKNLRMIKKIFGPEFSKQIMIDVLSESFGHLKMGDTLKPLIMPAYDIFNDTPIFFKSRYSKASLSLNAYIKDAVISTSSAPTYFKPHTFEHDNKIVSCIDGGVFVNNPAMSGIAEACKHYNAKVGDITLLSLGNGFTKRRVLPLEANNWGVVKWLRPVVRYMVHGNMETVDYETDSLLRKENYLRINPQLDKKYSEMSDASKETITYIVNLMCKYMKTTEYKREIGDFIDRL